VETLVHSDTYFDLVTDLKRAQSKASRTLAGLSGRILHLANLPAGTDIRRVREQLARMERRMVELSTELDGQRAEGEAPR
jgi:hypothetical protein